jgi:hypothetical protein
MKFAGGREFLLFERECETEFLSCFSEFVFEIGYAF